MNIRHWPFVLIALVVAALASIALHPYYDLEVSGWFYRHQGGFFISEQPLFVGLHNVAVAGGWVVGIGTLVGALITGIRQRPLLHIDFRGWLFLLMVLVVGLGLIANLTLKDHWGRARPHQVTEFGGAASFTPFFLPQPVLHKNGSFVAGDAAFGFYLPCIAYMFPLTAVAKRRPRSRYVFWGCVGAGACFGLARLVMGAHFLSDILSAALLMLIVAAALHAMLFGWRKTWLYWSDWLGLRESLGDLPPKTS